MKKIIKIFSILLIFVLVFIMSSCDEANQENTPVESIDYDQYIGTYELYQAIYYDKELEYEIDATDDFKYYNVILKEYRQCEVNSCTVSDVITNYEGSYTVSNNQVIIRIQEEGKYFNEFYDILDGELHISVEQNDMIFVIKLRKK